MRSTTEPVATARAQSPGAPVPTAAPVRVPVRPDPVRPLLPDAPDGAPAGASADRPARSGRADPPAPAPVEARTSAPAPAPAAAELPTERPVVPAPPPVQIGRIEVVVTAPEPAPDPFAGCHTLEAASGARRGGGW